MLDKLRAIVEQVTNTHSLEEALQNLVSSTRKAMHTDCCSVYLSDHNQHLHVLMASDGLVLETNSRVQIAFNEGIVGLIAAREEPVNLADAWDHPSFKHLPDVQEEAFRSFLGTPIIHQRKLMGVLVVQQNTPRQYCQNEESFLVTLASQLAGVIAHAEARGLLESHQANLVFLRGDAGSPGVAIANTWVCQQRFDFDSIPLTHTTQTAHELQLFKRALERSRDELVQLSIQFKNQLSQDSHAIFDVFLHMLADKGMGGEIGVEIARGYTAPAGVRMVAERYIQQFEAMSDPYLKERATDVRDLATRLLGHLGYALQSLPDVEGEVILVATEVTASLLAEVPKDKLKGIVSLRGAGNSHAAIIARGLGIPAVLGVDLPLEYLHGKLMIVDGYSGELFVSPDQVILEQYQELVAEEQAFNQEISESTDEGATTKDHVEISILLNAGLSADTEQALCHTACGIGLYRTELPFMQHASFPTIDEQYHHYRGILETFPDMPVVMRTLDVGGDKQLPYFPIVEENPFLGWRGIRLTLDHPEIFLLQLKAMVKANTGLNNLSIMLPMITTLQEFRSAKKLFEQAWDELIQEYAEQEFPLDPGPRPKFGIMLEVPSVLFILPELASEVDFWSVGTNDLTQYLLAVDRNNARVADGYDVFHPAVIRSLHSIAQASKKFNVPLSICGEVAGDPAGVVLLLGLGYSHLSMNTYNVGKIKHIIRQVSLADCCQIADDVLQMTDAGQIRRRLFTYLEMQGLGGFVRAGR